MPPQHRPLLVLYNVVCRQLPPARGWWRVADQAISLVAAIDPD